MQIKSDATRAVVHFRALGDMRFALTYGSPLLQDQLIDYPSVPEHLQAGQSRRLLCAAALSCFATTVYAALKSRGATILSLEAEGSAELDDGPPPRVSHLHLRVAVGLPDEQAGVLVKVRKVAENGCLITRSLAPAIRVTHEVLRK